MISKLAYQRMSQLRYCPPLEELRENHAMKCPYEHISYDFFPKGEKKAPVEPGQIWRTRPFGYDEDLYINSALVLTLEMISNVVARVALIHTEPELAAPGDVKVHGCFFAEMWNTFPFPISCLEHFVMKVDVSVLNAITLPDGPLPTLVHEYFRLMEADFAARLVTKTLNTEEE